MTTHRGPLGVGGILNAGSRLYRHNWAQLMVVSVITYLPLTLLAMVVAIELMPMGVGVEAGALVATPDAIERVNLILTGLALLTAVGLLVSIVALHHAVGGAYLGDDCDWRESIRRGLARALPALGAMLLAFPVPLVACVAGALMLVNSPAAGALVLAAAAVATVVAMLIAVIAIPVIVREGLGARTGLTRAWNLARGRLPSLIGLGILTSLLAGIAAAIVRGIVSAAITSGDVGATRVIVGAILGQAAGSVLFTPLAVAILTVAYFDLRIRGGEAPGRRRGGRQAGPTRPARVPAHGALLASRPGTPGAGLTRAGGATPPAAPPPGDVPVRGPRWAEPLGPG